MSEVAKKSIVTFKIFMKGYFVRLKLFCVYLKFFNPVETEKSKLVA